jgi:acetoin utilization protein AcuC
MTWRRAAGRNPPEHWFTTLRDAPRPGEVRDEVRRAVDVAVGDLPAAPAAGPRAAVA